MSQTCIQWLLLLGLLLDQLIEPSHPFSDCCCCGGHRTSSKTCNMHPMIAAVMQGARGQKGVWPSLEPGGLLSLPRELLSRMSSHTTMSLES